MYKHVNNINMGETKKLHEYTSLRTNTQTEINNLKKQISELEKQISELEKKP